MSTNNEDFRQPCQSIIGAGESLCWRKLIKINQLLLNLQSGTNVRAGQQLQQMAVEHHNYVFS